MLPLHGCPMPNRKSPCQHCNALQAEQVIVKLSIMTKMNANHGTTLLAWAQAKDKMGFSEKTIQVAPNQTPRDLIGSMPNGEWATTHCRIAVDQEFATWDNPVGNAKEIAIIPPVSGG